MKRDVFCLVIASNILFFGCIKAGIADEWYLQPGIKFNMGYSDNIRLDSSDKFNTSFSSLISPELVLGIENETSKLSLYSRVDFKRYYSIHEFDTDNQYMNLQGSKYFELSQINGGLSYKRDTTLEEFIDDTGNVDTKLNRRETTTADPRWTYSLSELTQVSLGTRFTTTHYPSNNAINSDYEVNTFSVSLNYQWKQPILFFINADRSKYHQDSLSRFTRIDYDGLTFGTIYNMSERLRVTGSVGQQKSDSQTIMKQSIPVEFQRNKSKSNLYSLELVNKFDVGSYKIRYNLSITPDSQGRLNDRNELSFNINNMLSEKASIDVNTRYFIQEATDSNDKSADREYFSVMPIYTYKISEHMKVSGSYQYQEINFTLSNTVERSNSFLVTYSYTFDKFKI